MAVKNLISYQPGNRPLPLHRQALQAQDAQIFFRVRTQSPANPLNKVPMLSSKPEILLSVSSAETDSIINYCFKRDLTLLLFLEDTKSSLVLFKYAVQFQSSSVAQSCLTLCDPMNRSTPGLPVHHQLPEFTQTQVHRVSDAIQPSHPLSSLSCCPQSLPASESFPMSQLFA